MSFRWHVLLATCFGLRCCNALANNATNNTTTSSHASSSASSRVLSSSLLLSDTQSDTTSLTAALSSSFSEAGLGSFILQGLGVTLSTTTSPTSTISSSSVVSSSVGTLNATLASQSTITQTSNGSFQDAQSCNSASKSWLSAHTNDSITSTSTSTSTVTSSTETKILPNGTVFTLCDHYPRMSGTPTYTVSTSIYVTTIISVTTLPPSCTGACPTCTIGNDDCSGLWSSYLSNTAVRLSDMPACARPAATTSSPTRSLTSATSSDSCTYEGINLGTQDCHFIAGAVRLVYFPPEIKGNRLCGNYTTVSPASNISTPVTVETFGTTFTSGTAYISFEGLSATDTCGNPTGTPMTSFFVPLPSSEISSMCGDPNGVFITGPTPTAVNYADLQTPIAKDIYKCQPNCIWGGMQWEAQCPTIYDNYAPALAYPTQVNQLQPEWSGCGFEGDTYFRYQYGQKYYLFDPPIALTKTNSEAGVTVPAETAPSQVTKPPVALTSQTSEAVAALPATSKPASAAPAPAVGEQPSPTSANTAPQTTANVIPDFAAPSTANDRTVPSNDQDTASSQPDPTPETVNDPSPAQKSDDPVVATPSEQPTDALGVFSDALGETATGNAQSAGATQAAAPADQSIIEPGKTAASPADPTSAPGLVVGSSVIAPLSQGQATSIDVPGADPVSVSRAGSGYVVGGQTLTPTVQGQQISVPQDAQVTPPAVIAPAPVVGISRSGSNYVVNGNTVTPGQATTIGGQAVSLDAGASALALGSSTIALQPGAATSVSDPIAAPGVQVSRSGSVYLVGGTTLSPGQSVVINGQTISEDPAGQHLVIGTKQISLSDGGATTMMADTAAPTALAVSRSGSAFVVDGTTLSPGVASVVDGQTVSVIPNGQGVLVGSQTFSLSDGDASTITPGPAGATQLEVSRSGSMIVVDGTTLSPGASSVIDGQTVSAFQNGQGVLVGSRTVSLSNGDTTTITPPLVDTMEITLSLTGSSIVVDGTTLSPGDSTVIDGQAISVLSNGKSVVIGSRTIALSDGQATTAMVSGSLSADGLVTIGSETLTAYEDPAHSSEVVLDGKTLTLGGPALTTEGETLSLGSSGLVMVGQSHTSTVVLTGAAATKASSAPTAAGGVVSKAAGATTTSKGQVVRMSWTWVAGSICLVLFSLCWPGI